MSFYCVTHFVPVRTPSQDTRCAKPIRSSASVEMSTFVGPDCRGTFLKLGGLFGSVLLLTAVSYFGFGGGESSGAPTAISHR
jgi:hypothetical protein